MKLFTLAHVGLSLAGVVFGLILLYEMLAGKASARWANVFFTAMALTDVTGFLLPAHRFLPSHGVGILSLIILALAFYAQIRRFEGPWAKVYSIGIVLALYLDVFVAIVQAFRKNPVLRALAPTQSEPSFLATQVVALGLFSAAAVVAARRSVAK